MDLPIRPKPCNLHKPRISHAREGWFDEHGKWQPFLRVTARDGRIIAFVQSLPEAFHYAVTYGVAA